MDVGAPLTAGRVVQILTLRQSRIIPARSPGCGSTRSAYSPRPARSPPPASWPARTTRPSPSPPTTTRAPAS